MPPEWRNNKTTGDWEYFRDGKLVNRLRRDGVNYFDIDGKLMSQNFNKAKYAIENGTPGVDTPVQERLRL